MLVRSLLTKSRKRLARDAFHTFATGSGLVHDAADTDSRWVQNDNTRGRVFATVRGRFFFLTNRASNRVKNCSMHFNNNNNNNVHLSCAHQRPERSHDTY